MLGIMLKRTLVEKDLETDRVAQILAVLEWRHVAIGKAERI